MEVDNFYKYFENKTLFCLKTSSLCLVMFCALLISVVIIEYLLGWTSGKSSPFSPLYRAYRRVRLATHMRILYFQPFSPSCDVIWRQADQVNNTLVINFHFTNIIKAMLVVSSIPVFEYNSMTAGSAERKGCRHGKKALLMSLPKWCWNEDHSLLVQNWKCNLDNFFFHVEYPRIC